MDVVTQWNGFRACPVCKASIGVPCYSLSGRITGGVPDGVRTPLTVPHRARRARASGWQSRVR